MAWALVLSILIGFLAVPIFSFAMRPAQDTRNIYAVKNARDAQMMRTSLAKGDTVTGDGAWSPGPLSKAHHALEGKCESCHVKAFVSVQDGACQTCHIPAECMSMPPPRVSQLRARLRASADVSLQASPRPSESPVPARASIAIPSMSALARCSRPHSSSAPTATVRWTSG